MKPKADALICDHDCDKLAEGPCHICEADTCSSHGTQPLVTLPRFDHNIDHFKITLDIIICTKCKETMERIQLSQISARGRLTLGTWEANAVNTSEDDIEFVNQLREGATEMFVVIKAYLTKKALLKK